MSKPSNKHYDDQTKEKRKKWEDEYLDAVDLRPAHEKQLDEQSDSQSDE